MLHLYLKQLAKSSTMYVCYRTMYECHVVSPIINTISVHPSKIIVHHESDEKALNAMINMRISIPTTNSRNV